MPRVEIPTLGQVVSGFFPFRNETATAVRIYLKTFARDGNDSCYMRFSFYLFVYGVCFIIYTCIVMLKLYESVLINLF